MKGGGPAFPVREAERFNPENNETHMIEQHWGMSLRDWFAGMVVSEILRELGAECGADIGAVRDHYGGAKYADGRRRAVKQAYQLADAMLAEKADSED